MTFWLLCLLSVPERGRLPSGSVLGGRSADRLLLHGSAVVRGRHRYLHRSHRQSEDGDGNIGSWRAAQVPGCEVGPVPRVIQRATLGHSSKTVMLMGAVILVFSRNIRALFIQGEHVRYDVVRFN